MQCVRCRVRAMPCVWCSVCVCVRACGRCRSSCLSPGPAPRSHQVSLLSPSGSAHCSGTHSSPPPKWALPCCLAGGSLLRNQELLSSASQSGVPEPAASAAPGNLLGAQICIFRTHIRLTEFETQTMSPGPLGDSAWLQLRSRALIISNHPHEPHTHCWGTAAQVEPRAGSLPQERKARPKEVQGQERTSAGLPHTVVNIVHCTSLPGKGRGDGEAKLQPPHS